ncbi:MAG: hypothetical protein ACI9WU_004685 [Myxococcota bacterium]|jgi:hypothetical protein
MRRDPVGILLAALVAAHLIALLAFDTFASQDGPSHAYNAHVLLNLDSAPYTTIYTSHWTPVPNWLGTALLVASGALMGVGFGEKLLLALCLILFTAGVRRRCMRPDGTTPPAVLLAPLLAWGYPLHMGFYSFCLGLAVIPWGWDAAARRKPAALLAWAAVAYLAHIVALLALVLGAAAELIGAPRRDRVKGLLAITVASLPAALWVGSRPPGGAVRWAPDQLAEALFTLRPAAAYAGLGEWIAIAAAALLVVLVGLAVKQGGVRPLATAAAMLLLVLALPDGGAGHWFLTERLILIFWVALLPVAALATVPAWTAAIGTCIALSGLATTLPHHEAASLDLADVMFLAPRLEPAQSLILLDFTDANHRRIRPMLHAAGRLAAATGGVDLGNYEAQTDHFQTRLADRVVMPPHEALLADPASLDLPRFKSRLRYILLRGQPPTGFLRRLEQHYVATVPEGPVRLYERR